MVRLCLFSVVGGVLLAGSAMAADPGLPVPFQCGSGLVEIAAGAEAAHLRRGGQWLHLLPTEAASGAKYAATGAPDVWAWNKGADWTVSLPGLGDAACTALPAPGALTAGGSEPGWQLALTGTEAQLTPQEGDAVSAAPEGATATADGVQLKAGPLQIALTYAICRDAATGMPHPYQVAVEGAGAALTGCGGDPASILTGLDRSVTQVAGQPVPTGVPTALSFSPDGRVTGQSGCNRFSGTYSLTGEGLTLGPLMTTRMACAEPAASVESAILAALQSVSRFDLDDAGALVLMAGDQPVLTAGP